MYIPAHWQTDQQIGSADRTNIHTCNGAFHMQHIRLSAQHCGCLAQDEQGLLFSQAAFIPEVVPEKVNVWSVNSRLHIWDVEILVPRSVWDWRRHLYRIAHRFSVMAGLAVNPVGRVRFQLVVSGGLAAQDRTWVGSRAVGR